MLNLSIRLSKLLKKNGAYDNSLIFILGDHGSGYGLEFKSDEPLADINLRALPLFLMKPINTQSKLIIDDRLISTGDLKKIVFSKLKLNGNNDSDFSRYLNSPHSETFYDFSSFRIGKDRYLKDLHEYRVNGFSWFKKSWTKTGKVYSSPE